MEGDTAVAIIVAVLSSSGIATIVTWLRDRRKLRSDAAASIVTAASGAVTTLERAIERLEKELSETRDELEESIRQNRRLMEEVTALRRDMEHQHKQDEGVS